MTNPTESPMTNQQHPITPPPELVQKWRDNVPGTFTHLEDETQLSTQAAQWGADQELEACEQFIRSTIRAGAGSRELAEALRAARRPKPPSLREQALADLDSMSIEPCWVNGIDVNASVRAKYDNIRRALEALPNDN